MGACATKSGDLKKVKGEPPLVEEDAAVAPPVAEGEKANKVDEKVPPAAETADPADVSRRRSLSDLLKEDAEGSDGEAGEEAVKVVTEESVVATDEVGASASISEEAEVDKAVEVAVEPSAAVVEQDTAEAEAAEQLADAPEPKAGQKPGDDVQSGEEEKRVDPDSVQVAAAVAAATVAALSAEGSEVADGASA